MNTKFKIPFMKIHENKEPTQQELKEEFERDLKENSTIISDKEFNELVDSISTNTEEDKWSKVDNVNPKHYTDMAISPHEYNKANNISWNEAQVIKYVSRWEAKNGLEDLEKAKWYLDDLIKGLQDAKK